MKHAILTHAALLLAPLAQTNETKPASKPASAQTHP